MGNVDVTTDQKLMRRHTDLVQDFKSQTPLFNIEDIKFPLFTSNIKIVDSTGRRVKLAGGNFSGAHMCRHCVDGLQCRPLRDIAMDIRYKFKMNCIRLTYSLQMFYDDKPVPAKYLKANPELIGKTGMEIFDHTVETLTDVGLMVILNNHTSSSQWCCSNDDGDGLWWSYQYPQYKFFQNCQEFARRYSKNPRVIGMDLRNELRKANGRDTTWGDGNALTDWHRAATICGEKVLKIAPHWLIFVSGVNYQLDLTGVQTTAIHYSVPNKLVYTGHFYGFSWPIPSWSLVSYQDFKKKLFNSQTFVRAMGYPYFLGQYGNNCQDIPWTYLIRYLKQTDIDWTYWALDGFKCEPEKDETYGVFTNDFKEARNPLLLQDMISVGPPHGTIIQPNRERRVRQGVFQQTKQKQYLLQRPKQAQRRSQQHPPQTNTSNLSNINNTGNIDPRLLLASNFSQIRQEQPVNPQVYQMQQQVRYTPQQQIQRPPQNPQYVGGFVGTRSPGQTIMTSSIRTNPIQTSNLQFNQQQPILQQQPIQQQQFVNLQTNQQNPQLKGQIPPQQYNQNQQPNQRNVVYFDSNGRPILR